MNSSIYDLSYDFIQQNGHYLVVTEKNGLPLNDEDWVPLQMKMIGSNQIPFLLPIKVEEMDFRAKLHYAITSKRMLSLFLKEKSLSTDDYYAFFLQVITALEESQLYLLDQERYVLKEDFIFIGKTLRDVYFTYFPFQEIPGKATVDSDLKALLINIGSEIQDLEGESFKTILAYTKDPSFHLHGLKELLLELQSNPRSSLLGSYEKEPSQENPLISMKESEPERNLLFGQSVYPDRAEYDSKPLQEFSEPHSSEPKRALSPLTQRGKILLFSSAFVALALIWKLYSSYSGQFLMKICVVLSFFVIAAVVVFWRIWRPGNQKHFIETNDAEDEGDFPTNFHFEPPAETIFPSQPLTDQRKQTSLNQADYYSTLHQNTTLLSRSDDTVLLDEAGSRENGITDVPYLFMQRNGKKEKVTISETPFLIGRNPATVQYVEDSVGVSRNHLEFTREGGVCVVKDLGSRNGSQLNGQRMVPYKKYVLDDKAELVIGEVQFTYQAGS